jgi:UDP-N-acetylmuramoyl-tripeptide--D-alanyl-D-alanine ligase
MLSLGTAVTALTGLHLDNDVLSKTIANVVIDSRQTTQDSVFVALSGEKDDGHRYVEQAFNGGAIAAFVEHDVGSDFVCLDLRDISSIEQQLQHLVLPVCLRVSDTLKALQRFAQYWRNQLDVRVVGITGSVGKTTTKELASSVLSKRFKTLKSEGNLNNEIGLPLSLLALQERHEYAVLEMGFYTIGEIKFLCSLASPHVGVITNVYPVHVERAGSLENIATGKSELVEALPKAPDGISILNADEPIVMAMRDKASSRIFTYGLNSSADLWASDVHSMGLNGIRFKVHYDGDTLHVRVPLLGRHSVHTALRAASIGLVEGLTWQEILEGLQAQDGQAQLRLYAVPGPQGSMLLDDSYNASPESTIAALNLLDDLDAEKRVAVLGDMLELGPFEHQGHISVGTRARHVVDLLVTVGELGSLIAEGALNAGMTKSEIVQCRDSKHALNYLSNNIGMGDVVLIKGSRGLGLDSLVNNLEILA